MIGLNLVRYGLPNMAAVLGLALMPVALTLADDRLKKAAPAAHAESTGPTGASTEDSFQEPPDYFGFTLPTTSGSAG